MCPLEIFPLLDPARRNMHQPTHSLFAFTLVYAHPCALLSEAAAARSLRSSSMASCPIRPRRRTRISHFRWRLCLARRWRC
ncbi:hypothetical protein C8R44DRAFT_845713 [Mycena epipterygia]|nr:hypothetical protein C8R44DRAFT_845713 [Mycena epipterygia]